MAHSTRPMALAAAAVAITALAACSSATVTPAAEPALAPSSAAVASTPAPPAELTVAEFVDRFGPATGDMVWLSGAEVEDEFHAAAAAFPLDLPAGYTWPTEMSRSRGTVTEWQRGTGVAEAYLYWEAAHATAAYAAWRSGDMVSAVAQVEVLVDGYASPIRSMYVDPEEPGTDSEYYRSVLEPALNGRLEPLVHAQVASFISTDEYLAIAAQAGDVIQVGSEGFSRSISDQPGDPGYIEDVRVELEHRIPSE